MDLEYEVDFLSTHNGSFIERRLLLHSHNTFKPKRSMYADLDELD